MLAYPRLSWPRTMPKDVPTVYRPCVGAPTQGRYTKGEGGCSISPLNMPIACLCHTLEEGTRHRYLGSLVTRL